MTNLPNPPWTVTGAYMMPDQRSFEVFTVEDLVFHLDSLLALSPSTEVVVTRNLEAAS